MGGPVGQSYLVRDVCEANDPDRAHVRGQCRVQKQRVSRNRAGHRRSDTELYDLRVDPGLKAAGAAAEVGIDLCECIAQDFLPVQIVPLAHRNPRPS